MRAPACKICVVFVVRFLFCGFVGSRLFNFTCPQATQTTTTCGAYHPSFWLQHTHTHTHVYARARMHMHTQTPRRLASLCIHITAFTCFTLSAKFNRPDLCLCVRVWPCVCLCVCRHQVCSLYARVGIAGTGLQPPQKPNSQKPTRIESARLYPRGSA